ncbi:MAG: hypothetical protein A2W19_13810 [Spirochaetes bacterium RBG_16_49_21]|nr:MAG: hypothetical protein A2W19_13810 [Spirochaetes bacterium RBG_16_49_21]
MEEKIYTGILTQKDNSTFLTDSRGRRHFEREKIWSGYVAHWLGKKVNARYVRQKDYDTGRNIVIMRPHTEPSAVPFVELYYNERLVKYKFSLLGHLAINVNGGIFNFSHLINENEIISEEEYFYRPALGEFAPHPVTGRFNVEDKTRPYYDKFGRNFMRTIHVLRMEGVDAGRLGAYYKTVLSEIVAAPDPKRPEKYRDFSLFTRSCVTIIRDGLLGYGFRDLKGIFPRDFFINAAYNLLKLNGSDSLQVKLFRMPQLKVPEALYSALTVITNPINRVLAGRLPDY